MHILEKESGKELPKSYLEQLDATEALEIIVNEYEDGDKYDNRYWQLMPKQELLETFEMKEVGKAKAYECLKLYIKLFKEFSHSDSTDSNLGDIALSRVSEGFVFGEENGDYLYFDSKDNNSIWIYYHDGGDVKKVSDSFDEVLKFQ